MKIFNWICSKIAYNDFLRDISFWIYDKLGKVPEPELEVGDYVIDCSYHPGVVLRVYLEDNSLTFKNDNTRYGYDILSLVTGAIGSCSERHCIGREDKIENPIDARRIADVFRNEGYVNGMKELYKLRGWVYSHPDNTTQEESFMDFVNTWREGDVFCGRKPGHMISSLEIGE